MPRYPRNYIKTCYFHVIAQVINKNYIFAKKEDIEFYLEKMNQLKKECEIEVVSYCIMNNHVHMLLKTYIIENLSKYMQRLNTIYAQYYNKKYQRVGYVFRNRYKSEGIYNDDYLYNCIKYIHNNPVKAGICKYPWEYPYSSYDKKKINYNETKQKYIFMDVDVIDNKTCENAIIMFLEDNKVKKEQLKEDEDTMKKLIKYLKDEQKISLRKIAESLEINREKIRKLYNNIKLSK